MNAKRKSEANKVHKILLFKHKIKEKAKAVFHLSVKIFKNTIKRKYQK